MLLLTSAVDKRLSSRFELALAVDMVPSEGRPIPRACQDPRNCLRIPDCLEKHLENPYPFFRSGI
jgi:hypothetical protein